MRCPDRFSYRPRRRRPRGNAAFEFVRSEGCGRIRSADRPALARGTEWSSIHLVATTSGISPVMTVRSLNQYSIFSAPDVVYAPIASAAIAAAALAAGDPIDCTNASVAAASVDQQSAEHGDLRPVDDLGQTEQVIAVGGRRRQLQRADQRAARDLVGGQARAGQCDTEPEHRGIDQHAGFAEVLAGMARDIRSAEIIEPGSPVAVAAVAGGCRIVQQRQREQRIDAVRPARTARAVPACRPGRRDRPSGASPNSRNGARGRSGSPGRSPPPADPADADRRSLVRQHRDAACGCAPGAGSTSATQQRAASSPSMSRCRRAATARRRCGRFRRSPVRPGVPAPVLAA